MASGRTTSSSSAVFHIVAVCMLLSSTYAFKPAKISAKDIFYNPKNLSLYVIPNYEFGLPACGPRDDDFRFTVSYDALLKAPVMTLKYSTFDTQPTLQFQAFTKMQLNFKTGVLTLVSYGATISVDLKTYLATDRIQSWYSSGAGGKGKRVLGQEPVVYDAISDIASAPTTDLDGAVTAVLRYMAKAAKTFSVSSIKYPCREKTTVAGTPAFKTLATWLDTLRLLPTKTL